MPHIHDKIDFTTEVFIVYKNKVLLRKHDKYKIWLGVGGHIELDEDPPQAAVREAKEEVGLDITLYDSRQFKEETETARELIAPAFLNRHKINDVHEHISFIYFATSTTDRTINQEDELSEEMHWFELEELDSSNDILPRIKVYARAALNAPQS